MGGINDITQKIKGWQYTEVIYTEKPEDTIHRVTKDFDECADKIRGKGATPIFCTITSCDIAKYNQHMLNKGWTRSLKHTEEYAEMQSQLEHTVQEINAHLISKNQHISKSTPYCHSAVHKIRGSSKRYYKWVYDRLWDGVHGTLDTKENWAHIIGRAIHRNTLRQNDSDSEDGRSPKRAWLTEKRIKLDY